MTSKIEFFVEMTCDSCAQAIRKNLNDHNGIKNIDIQLDKGTVIVESTLPINVVKELIQETGRKAVLKGSASSLAAVAMIENEKIQGVIRLMQNDTKDETCIIDGTVDGLQSFPHFLKFYECGDLSKNCESTGSPYEPVSLNGKKSSSDLAVIKPDENGRTSFRLTKDFNLSDVIGRSVVITDENEKKIACGIVARSAGLFQNPKTICACDGVSIWDENTPLKSTL